MTKPKILIVGGGIGGLSCATALAETGKFDISIFESDIIGGQASTRKSKLCNTETAWRLFGDFYTNISKLIIDIGAKKNFYVQEKGDVCILDHKSGSISLYNTFKNINWYQRYKLLSLYLLCKERLVNNYRDITAHKYFRKSRFIDVVLGPYSGQETTKVTLSTIAKITFSFYEKSAKDNFSNKAKLTKYPTSDSLFKPWEKYLQNKGVKIYEHNKLTNITYSNGKIKNIIINDKKYVANEIVFACSLRPLINIFKNNVNLNNTIINKKLNILKSGQQLYISVNFYWKKNIMQNRKCHIYTFNDGWLPILVKRFINNDYIDKNCNKNIKEVWNIGCADYLKGKYVKKYTSQCSFEEIVYEIKMNIINSEHFKKYFDFENNNWDDYFYDYEFDDRYYKKLPTMEKFSINKGIEENLLNNKEPELGNNIYFSAYYVKNTTGAATMETSCEIGLTTADLICKKYNINNPRKPIYKTREYTVLPTLPFVFLDKLLYKLNLKPITDSINPLILLIICFVIIINLIFKIYKFSINNKELKKYFKLFFIAFFVNIIK